MELNGLTAISPVDGRYRSKCEAVAPYFSEYALIRYRIKVEVEYFIALSDLGLHHFPTLEKEDRQKLREIYRSFDLANAEWIKEKEKETNHDVKAVEYFVKKSVDDLGLEKYREFVHFGLTSQDINNTAIPMALRELFNEQLFPAYQKLLDDLNIRAEEWEDVPMLALTHGQPASPTRVGKELRVFIERLEAQLAHFEHIPFSAKLGGATGNFNAHHIAYPNVDWPAFADDLVVKRLGLSRSQTTTQIEHYDNLAAFFHALQRLNTILTDLARDLWSYISMDRFKQRAAKDEVGSSAMPHKVNPIDLENAEGNLGMANASFQHLASKLPLSRMQRDLTDSTVTRNIGVPVAQTLLALDSLQKGIGKLQVNEKVLREELDVNWSVLSEAIQTVLRREGIPDPYEKLKAVTRDKGDLDQEAIQHIIEELDVEEPVKEELHRLTPWDYTGI
ncbi:MAG: adenylosuccinate lyase [Flavobacteriales bacterium]